MSIRRTATLLLALGLVVSTFVWADAPADIRQPAPTAPPVSPQPEVLMPDMGHMDMSGAQGGRPPPDARDPDYSDGQAMSAMPGMMDSMNDGALYSKVLFDQLEYTHSPSGNGVAVDAQAYYGGDANKLWLKLDGERSDGHLQDTRMEALWAHSLAAFWDTQVGVRHDAGEGPTRDWAAFGLQGLAPYWFNVEATAYVGPSGRTALRMEAEYDLRLTQRLILTPDLEVNLYGKADPARQIGAGLSNAELGLRLRYEVSRQFAPYIGVDWNRRMGGTADLLRADGRSPFDHEIVIGARIWF